MKNGMETARVGMRDRPMAARRALFLDREKEFLVSVVVVVGRMAMVSREIVAGRDWELTMAVGMSSCTGGLVVIGPPVISAP